MLENKYYMENILTLTKSLITISLNGTIESSNKNVRKVFDESLKTLLSLQEKLFDELKEKKTSIAFGTLTGWELLNGKGPPIPLKISASGSVNTDIKSDFLNAGINQTLHRIYILIHSKISVVMPGCSCVTEVDTTVLAAETVIIGKVPNFYGGSAPGGMCSVGTDEKSKE